MKRKLFSYMFLLASILLFTLISGLTILGRFSNTRKELFQTLNLQMEVFSSDVESYWDGLAAKNINLASDMADVLEQRLKARRLAFSELTDNSLAISDIEKAMIDPLCQYLRQADCSGAFVLLDTTVNSSLENSEKSRSGLYIQKSSMSIPDYKLLLYRGIAAVGKQHDVVPHRKWHQEFNTDFFPDYEMLITQKPHAQASTYDISAVTVLPGTSENIVLLTLPIVGKTGQIYGLCGFEISQSWFKTKHSQPSSLTHMICLFNANSEIPDANHGFSAGIENGYYVAPKGSFSIAGLGDGLVTLSGESDEYVGIVRKIPSFAKNHEFLLTVMIPKRDYSYAVAKNNFQITFLLLLILSFMTICCYFFSHRFLAPFLKSLEQLRMNEKEPVHFDIPEIDDLLDSLLEKTIQTEETILSLEQQIKQKQEALEQLQKEYEVVLKEHESTQMEISRLADSRKSEIDLDQYQRFLECLDTLTNREKEILNLYVQGKSSKEIIQESNITENTLKYHNRNIYSKLGVNSRKQLLMYVALMKQE